MFRSVPIHPHRHCNSHSGKPQPGSHNTDQELQLLPPQGPKSHGANRSVLQSTRLANLKMNFQKLRGISINANATQDIAHKLSIRII